MGKNIRSLDKNYSFFTDRPFASPLYVMLKPVGSRCNMACEYCYYLGKSDGRQYNGDGGGQSRSNATAAGTKLSDELLEEFTRQYLEAQTMPEALFTWHGGEPLLRPIAFYEKALHLQRRYARGRHVDNCLQTNGTLLTDEWCQFLHDNGFLVGISIDGPQWMHDHYRHGSASAGDISSWQRTMRGIALLRKHGVEWNAMATVNDLTARHPKEFYRFFRDMGCEFLQFTPVVEPAAGHSPMTPGSPRDTKPEDIAPYSVTPQAWGDFLCTVYDEWVKRDVGRLFVQTFDATLANWAGEPPGVCSLSPVCGHATVMETDGSLYSCDHFVFPEYRLGNIRHEPLTSLVYGERQHDFGRQKLLALPRQCRECRWLFACHGECPRNRFTKDRYGNPGLNYLCQGYRQFFSHVAPDMDFMTAELRAGRPPANIMNQKDRTGQSS